MRPMRVQFAVLCRMTTVIENQRYPAEMRLKGVWFDDQNFSFHAPYDRQLVYDLRHENRRNRTARREHFADRWHL